MKKLVFILSLFLSWQVFANNSEGGPDVGGIQSDDIQYQSVDGVIYDQHGNRYVLEGTFKYPDGLGNVIEKDCAGTELITDPGFNWSENWYRYTAGEIAGPECKKVHAQSMVINKISQQNKTLLDYGLQSVYSCNCSSASIDCGPSAICIIGGCNSVDECLSSGSEPCLGLCKSIDIDPR
jgi:hypothetical protein